MNDILGLSFTYSYEDIEISDVADDVVSSISPSKAITSSIQSNISRDTRDNIFDASRGNKQSLSIQYAGGLVGGDINYVKAIAKSSWYFPTFWKFVLSVNSTLGAIDSFAPSTEVPIYDRLYIGGAETVRGYKYRTEIGPIDGGKVMAVCNVEYKFPIIQEKKRTILHGALFYDIGGSWLNASNIDFSLGHETTKLKAGFGFGIRFTTPTFPLRLDWGYGLNHKDTEDLRQLYFTIGSMF